MVVHGGKLRSEVLQPQLDGLCPPGNVQLTTLSFPIITSGTSQTFCAVANGGCTEAETATQILRQ